MTGPGFRDLPGAVKAVLILFLIKASIAFVEHLLPYVAPPMPLPFQNPQQGPDGGVTGGIGQSGLDFGRGGAFPLVEHIHDLAFAAAEVKVGIHA